MTPQQQLNAQYQQAIQNKNAWQNKVMGATNKLSHQVDLAGLHGAPGANPAINSQLSGFINGLGQMALGQFDPSAPQPALQPGQTDTMSQNINLYKQLGLTPSMIGYDPNKIRQNINMDEYQQKLAQDANYNPFAMDYGALEKKYMPAIEKFGSTLNQMSDSYKAYQAAMNQNQFAGSQGSFTDPIHQQFTDQSGKLHSWRDNTIKNINAAYDAPFNQAKTKLDTWLADKKKQFGDNPKLTDAYNTQLDKIKQQIDAKRNAALGQVHEKFNTTLGSLTSSRDNRLKYINDQYKTIESNRGNAMSTAQSTISGLLNKFYGGQ
jgi:hypothetical protein